VNMAAALCLVHPGNPFSSGGELALLYLVGFVAIALSGPGALSFDSGRRE